MKMKARSCNLDMNEKYELCYKYFPKILSRLPEQLLTSLNVCECAEVSRVCVKSIKQVLIRWNFLFFSK